MATTITKRDNLLPGYRNWTLENFYQYSIKAYNPFIHSMHPKLLCIFIKSKLSKIVFLKGIYLSIYMSY